MRSLKTILICAALLGACGGDDDTTPPPNDSGGGMSPVISMVEWTHAQGCTPGVMNDVNVMTMVSDADTPTAMLTFSGMASGCTGTIDSADATISCPEVTPYPTAITVRDPEGNSDNITGFTISPCVDDSAQ